MKQFFGLLFSCAVLTTTLALSACLPSLQNKTATVSAASIIETPMETIKIAMLLPLTGKNAALGETMQNAASLAMNDLNARGIEISFLDTMSTPEGARDAAQKAVTDNTRLVLGPIFADDVRAARNIMATTTIPMIAFSTDMSVASLGTFIMGVLPQDQARHIAAFAAGRGARNTLIIAPNDPYGQLMVHTYSLTFRGTGGAIASPIWTTATDTDADLSNKIAGVMSSNTGGRIDSIFIPLPPTRAAKIVETATRFIGENIPLILGTGAWDDTDVTSAPALDGAFFAAPSTDLRQQFERNYTTNFGGTAPRLASLSYDSVALAVTLGRTLGPSGYTFTSLTNSSGFAGINGLFRFKPDGTIERALAIMTIAPGGPAVAEPGLAAFTPTAR